MTSTTLIEPPRGMAGVAVDTTRISEVDGARGELRYRGYPIEQLATRGFLDVVALVVDGELPNAQARQALAEALSDRTLPPTVTALLHHVPRDTHAMTLLQIALPLFDSATAKRVPVLENRDAQRRALFSIAAKIPTLIASWMAVQAGRALPIPDATQPLHADFLRMAHDGKTPTPAEVALLDATQILQMEHSLNASTFAARVVASTLSPLSMSLSAAVGALFGPLHGGADEAAYRMALAIGTPDKAQAFVDDALARKQKIMGLGHREYKVVDPRAVVLRELAQKVAAQNGLLPVLQTLAAVDDYAARRFAEDGKPIRANVEFYKGAVFASLGIAPEYFTTLFVMARVFGWGAHILELWDDHKLYRPAAQYRGEPRRNIAAT